MQLPTADENNTNHSMKILLLGEYSGLHLTLAQGLRTLGHEVLLVSDGDGFKNYTRDIDIKRKSSGFKDTLANLSTVWRNLKSFKDYDVVQIINPNFTNLNTHINLYLYRYLKKHNKKIFLGAFGDDYFWVKACLDKKFRYSEFFVDGKENKLEENNRLKADWLGTIRQKANIEIADTCNGIIACLYEYYTAYQDRYSEKLVYIPLPVNTDEVKIQELPPLDKVRFFIGINKARNEFKGTNLLSAELDKIYEDYPDLVSIVKAESLSYDQYKEFVKQSHVVLDQIYSYTPAMNGLLALALGKVLVGGGEPEMYELLGEEKNRPIVNVYPSGNDIYKKLQNIVLHKDTIKQISLDGRLFVEKHHDYVKIAEKYVSFWSNK